MGLHYKIGNFVESQKLIDDCISNYPKFKFNYEKLQHLKILIDLDQVNFHKHIFNF